MRLASKKFTFLLFLQIRSGTAVTVFRRSPLPLVSVFAGLVPGHRSSDEIKHDDTKYTRNGDADIVQRGGIHGCLINHIAEAVVVEDDLAGNSLGHVRGQIGGQASRSRPISILRWSGETSSERPKFSRMECTAEAARVLMGPELMQLIRMPLAPRSAGKVAHGGFESSLGNAHDVIGRHNSGGTEIGHGEHR